MKEFFVMWDGASVGESLCGTLFLEDLDRIFSRYYYGVTPWSIRDRAESLQPGETIRYIFPGTTDTIEICNASDLLYE